MPNTGRPSPACYLCRKRRVKCDLNPSGCLRCAKIGKDCFGYREEQDLRFHNQDKDSFVVNGVSARRARERDLPRVFEEDRKSLLRGSGIRYPSLKPINLRGWPHVDSSCSKARDRPMALEPSRWPLVAGEISPTIPPQIAENWGAYCIPIVLHQFSVPTDGSRFYGYLDFLPELYRESNEESCLGHVTNVVAKAYIVNTSHTLPDRKTLGRLYGRALRLTNAALQDPLERVKDSTTIAVWLLGIYEILVSSPKKSFIAAPEAYHAHSEGLTSLLRIRGPKQFSTRRGRNLFWMMYLFIQTHCLIANIKGPPQSLDWFDLLRSQLSEDDRLAFAVSNYNYRVSVLCPRILQFIKHSHKDQRQLVFQSTNLLTETDALHTDIKAWSAGSPSQPADLASLHVYNALRAALLKLEYFTTLLISHLISRFNGALISQNLINRREKCAGVIRQLSNEIIRSIPLVLGDPAAPPERKPGCWADALRLLWPLIAVAWVPDVLQHQREESRQALLFIGGQMGISLALDCDPPQGRFTKERISRNC